MLINGHFLNTNGQQYALGGIVSEVAKFIREEPTQMYRIVIGSDSQVKRSNGSTEIDFVTAIVAHRVGCGARYFWNKKKSHGQMVLRNRIYQETLMSVEVAQKFAPKLRKTVSPTKYDFEIHVDVGPLGATRDMIKEVVGIVQGNGFRAKTKPDSWGASSVADKHA